MHEPPRRCLIALPNFKKDQEEENEDYEEDDDDDVVKRGIMVSDFLFPGESQYDSVDSVREVFGFYPSIANMDDDLELVASPQQMVSQVASQQPPPPGSAPPSTQQEAEMLQRQKHRRFNAIAFGLSGVVILIGIFVSYFSMSNPVDDGQGLAEDLAKAFKDSAEQAAKNE